MARAEKGVFRIRAHEMDELVVRLSLYSGTKLPRMGRASRSPRRSPRGGHWPNRGARNGLPSFCPRRCACRLIVVPGPPAKTEGVCVDARSGKTLSVKPRRGHRAATRCGAKNRAEIQKVQWKRRDGHVETGSAKGTRPVQVGLCHRNDTLTTELGLQRSENGVRSRDGHFSLDSLVVRIR
jgi:hypothetical protein